MRFRVLPIPAAISAKARSSGKSPQYGHPAHSNIARGYGPCRSCLQTFRENLEERLLFTYNPFAGLAPIPQPGPIFVHTATCEPFAKDEFPPDLLRLPLFFEALNAEGMPLARVPMKADEMESSLHELLARPGTAYVHIRNAEAGCFVAHVERAEI